MAPAPSILLIDDGELVRVRYVLERMGVSFEYRTGLAAEEGVPRPRHLLVCSVGRGRLIPDMEMPDEDCGVPIWVCAHSQDYLPMRRQLKKLGFHYLIHSQLDREVMRLFFLQLLYRGSERRLNSRLSILCELRYAVDGVAHKGKLEELSRDGCRLFSAAEAAVGAPAVVYLPPELARGGELELHGRVAQCSPADLPGGGGFSVIVVFHDLEAEARAQIESILEGDNMATRITPLEPVPDTPSAPYVYTPPPEQTVQTGFEDADEDEDRRAHERREYSLTLAALNTDAADVLLGCDLSRTGMRIQHNPALSVGDQISIALYPSRREEPMILAAEVLREDQKGLGLRFVSLTPEQQLRLDYMLEHLEPLESLADGATEGEPLVVSKLVRTDD